MKCARCGSVMEPEAPRTVTATVRDTPVSVTVPAPECPKCGHVAILGKTLRGYTRAAAEAYRRTQGLLTVAEMERARRALGMSREEFSEYVFVGIATFKRWLRGEIQSKPYDKLVRLRTDLVCLEATTSELLERMAAANSSDSPATELRTRRHNQTMAVSMSDQAISCPPTVAA